MSTVTPSPREEFAAWVHDALNHLYDSAYLQGHPLAEALAGGQGSSLPRSQHLRRVLLEAIQGMRPEAGAPAQSSDWRAYRLLELRYLEGLSPSEVMSQLALSKSQYFREQGRVLDAITARLWERWQGAPAAAGTAAEPGPATREDLARTEAERLSDRATWETVDVAQLLGELRAVVEPLARVKAVQVSFPAPAPLPGLRADRVMLRQAILNVITYALDLAPNGQVEIAGLAEGAGLRVTARGPGVEAPRRQGVGLDIGRQLVSELGGTLHLAPAGEGEHWEARLVWPPSQTRTLLVIDDNRGFVDLFRRYLAAADWRVVGAVDGAEARRLMAATRPTVIVLDVMMPREDGWEVLMALKSDAATRDIPVIICSVLTEPQLAATLGAAAYLPKPVSQPALLQALAPWSAGGASPTPAP